MTDSLIVTFVCAFVGAMALMLGFLIKNFVEGLQHSIDRLNVTIKEMGAALAHMEKRLDDVERNDRDHDEELDHLHSLKCPNVGCPYAALKDQPRYSHVRRETNHGG